MSEDQSTPKDAPRPEGEPSFSFTDKRKFHDTGADGESAPAGDDAAAQSGADGAVAGAAPSDGADAGAQAGADGAVPSGEADPSAARIAELEAQLAELTEDRKRDQAEYVNSRRRIEAGAKRDVEAARAAVISSLLGVLDDITLARQHGDLAEGTPFASIAQKLEDVLRSQGLEQYGQEGEEFDPTIHEALMHREEEGVEVTAIDGVMQPGYRWNERVLRPARVGTVGPQ